MAQPWERDYLAPPPQAAAGPAPWDKDYGSAVNAPPIAKPPLPPGLQGPAPSVGDRARYNLPRSIANLPALPAPPGNPPMRWDPKTSKVSGAGTVFDPNYSLASDVASPVTGLVNMLDDPKEAFAEDPAGTVAAPAMLAAGALRGGGAAGAALRGGAKAAGGQVRPLMSKYSFFHPVKILPDLVDSAKEVGRGAKRGIEAHNLTKDLPPVPRSTAPESILGASKSEPMTAPEMLEHHGRSRSARRPAPEVDPVETAGTRAPQYDISQDELTEPPPPPVVGPEVTPAPTHNRMPRAMTPPPPPEVTAPPPYDRSVGVGRPKSASANPAAEVPLDVPGGFDARDWALLSPNQQTTLRSAIASKGGKTVTRTPPPTQPMAPPVVEPPPQAPPSVEVAQPAPTMPPEVAAPEQPATRLHPQVQSRAETMQAGMERNNAAMAQHLKAEGWTKERWRTASPEEKTALAKKLNPKSRGWNTSKVEGRDAMIEDMLPD